MYNYAEYRWKQHIAKNISQGIKTSGYQKGIG